MINFLPLINNSVTIELSFFITKHISNHIIKSDYYFTFFIWAVFFNVFIKNILIIRVFINTLESLKYFEPVFPVCQLKIDILLFMDL